MERTLEPSIWYRYALPAVCPMPTFRTCLCLNEKATHNR